MNKTICIKGVDFDFVYIKPGTFLMWLNTGEPEVQPVHKVTLTKGFWMGKYEVTQEQWEAVMGSNPSQFRGAKRPVEMVSWDDCQSFVESCNWFLFWNDKTKKFRLPTEAEWEYACRAGTTTRFYWGDDPSGTQIGDYAWHEGNAGKTTHPVGEKKPNAWGLHDMSGNVLEWCLDRYGDAPVIPQIDPTGPGSGSDRVYRGGSWYSLAGLCRSAGRYGNVPGYRLNILGFRLLMTST